MLSSSAIREIAEGEGTEYIFDFSRINSSLYKPLFRSLQYFIPKRVQKITITSNPLKNEFAAKNNSIAQTKKDYIYNLFLLLCHVIPKSTILKSISLSHINFSQKELLKIFEAFEKNSSIEEINIKNIPFGDYEFQFLIKHLNAKQIKTLRIESCPISDESKEAIIDFLQTKEHSQINTSFEFINTNLSDKANEEISRTINKQQSQKSIDELREENYILRKEFQELFKSCNGIKLNENVYVFGKQSKEFVRFLFSAESQIQELEQLKSSTFEL